MFVVTGPYAGSEPFTMMIKLVHAITTKVTVKSPFRSGDLTSETVL